MASRLVKIPARMSFEEIAAKASEAHRRSARARNRPVAPAARSKRSIYAAAQVNRLSEDWVTSILHPDDEMRWSLRQLRARSRELERNNPFYRAWLGAMSVNVLGPTGPKLQAQVRNNPTSADEEGKLNKRINDRLEAAWGEWSEAPTVAGDMSRAQFDNQCLRGLGRDGEIFVKKHFAFDNKYRFAVQAIDPDQVDEFMNRTGEVEVRMGIEVDPLYNRRIAYHVWTKPMQASGSSPRSRQRVPAEEILHLFDPDRVNSIRGVPWGIAVMWPLHMLAGYMESEAVAARAGAAKMGFWTKKPDDIEAGEMPTDEGTNSITMDAAPGSFEFGPPGYELQTWDAKHPSTAYAEFVKTKLREIASGLGMSYNALANDLEGVSYSSMRSGLLVERDVWRRTQELVIGSYLTPIYRDFVRMALLSGELVLDSRDFRKFLAHEFSAHGWPWVDPLKEAQAAQVEIGLGLTSRRRLLAEQGLDFETILEDLKREAAMAQDAGVTIAGAATTAKASDDDEEKDKDDKDENRPPPNGNGRLAGYLEKL